MKLRNAVLVLLVTTSLVATAFAKGSPKGRVSNLPITTDLQTNDLDGYVSDIQNDVGSYYDGVDSVTSFLTTNGYNGIVWGDWQFGTLDSTTRKVTFSFTSPISISDGGTAVPNPPFSVGMVVAHIEDKCTMLSYSMIQMSAGDTMPCPLVIHFYTADGGEWRILMEPNLDSSLPGTSFVQVSCKGEDSAGCNDWYIDPFSASQGGDPLGAVGRLNHYYCSAQKHCGGKTITENRGDYHFRFHFHLTRP
jgi:hypothetical protein